MADNSVPLTDTDLESIKAALVQLDEASALIAKAKIAGIDVTGFENRSREARDQLLQVKQAFFPGR